jgi:hypothetical protein
MRHSRTGEDSGVGDGKDLFNTDQPLAHLVHRGHAQREHPFLKSHLAYLGIRGLGKNQTLNSRSDGHDFVNASPPPLSCIPALVSPFTPKSPDSAEQIGRNLKAVHLLLGEIHLFLALLADLLDHALSHDQLCS